MPKSEITRLALLAHLDFDDMAAGRAPECWQSLVFACAVAQRLLTSEQYADTARQAAQDARQALDAASAGQPTTPELIEPALAFLPVWESVLRSTSWRRLHEVQRVVHREMTVETAGA